MPADRPLESLGRWLDGLEPAWTLLEPHSVAALLLPPLPPDGAVRLASDLSLAELDGSPAARNALILLERAATDPGLKLTAAGNLSRGGVAEMLERLSWPDFDKADLLRSGKPINEESFQALFFLRHVVQRAGLVRRYKGLLKVTPAGREVQAEPARGALQALLFHLAFWGMNLDYFGFGKHPGWPQCDIGVVLWSLSVAATDWQSAHRLTRLCTVPTEAVVEDHWDSGSFAFATKVLNPLVWFGVLERRRDDGPASSDRRSYYRRTALFDRFLRFDVRLTARHPTRH